MFKYFLEIEVSILKMIVLHENLLGAFLACRRDGSVRDENAMNM